MMFKQTMVSWSVAGALLVMCGSAGASGFALIEQSASGMGNAFAGGAAIAEDASTVFFNPAGMSRLSGKQIVIAAHVITPSAKFTDSNGVASGGDAGSTVVQGTDSTWGYNLGALYNFDSATRVGVAYRSAVSYTLSGTVTTSLPFANGPVSLDIKLPGSFSISGFHSYSDKWDVMADVTWTGWSTFKQVKILDATGATISNTPENWKDTMRVSVGVTHHYNQQWLARAGLAYDKAPVSDAFRTARIPDNNRTWLALAGSTSRPPPARSMSAIRICL